eukprot:CAMPEP_0176277952 /NCGR_PEP_ID=MMETSP0121_2-20121125/48538_1 /TAXON_ID=160619 /ORGANISM="Kryptoperidinium foliaceum, Strain CCMP 1326" /LENGTH=245 /DNA_ID=CAMNT_0017618259 /DNA_START=66 /DNA_END=801 /DNA_ORIENTATION=-
MPFRSAVSDRRRRSPALLVAAAAAVAVRTASWAFAGPASPALRGGVGRAAGAGHSAGFDVGVELAEGGDVTRAAVEDLLALTLAPYEGLVRRVDVGIRTEEGAGAVDVAVGLRQQEHPIVVSARRRAEMTEVLSQVTRSVARELEEEQQRSGRRSQSSTAQEAAGGLAEAVSENFVPEKISEMAQWKPRRAPSPRCAGAQRTFPSRAAAAVPRSVESAVPRADAPVGRTARVGEPQEFGARPGRR